MNMNLEEKTVIDKVIELMCLILELSEASKKIVTHVIKQKGVKEFFDSAETLELVEDEMERIKALRTVIESKEQEISMREGSGKLV